MACGVNTAIGQKQRRGLNSKNVQMSVTVTTSFLRVSGKVKCVLVLN
jgi:hypothetical protein